MSQKATYRRLLGYLKPHRAKVAIAIVGMVMFAVSEAGFAYLMKPLLDQSFDEASADSLGGAWVPLAIMGVFVIRGVGAFLSSYLMGAVGLRIISTIRRQVFSRYLAVPMDELRSEPRGNLVSVVTYDAQQVANAATDALIHLIRDSLTALALIALMFWHSWQLSLVFLTAVPLIAVLAVYVTRRYRRINESQQKAMASMNHELNQSLSAMPMVRIYNAQQAVNESFQKAEGTSLSLQLKELFTKSVSSPLIQFLVALTLAIIIYLGSSQARNGNLTVGDFMSFITAMLMLFQPLRGLSNVNAILQRGLVAAETIFARLDGPSESDNGDRSIEDVAEISLQDLCAQYGETQALHQVNLNLARGEQVALVGPSGSGKSTLVSLLTRLANPSAGQISADGLNIADIGLNNWRDQLSYVGQEVFLMTQSVAQNVAFGQSEIDRQKAKSCLEAAGAWSFVESLDGGMDHWVEDGGQNFSGGERQRIAIARALYRDAPIIIFDEATSALDNTAERVVIESIRARAGDRIILIIAHRLSSIEHCDRIVVLHQGEIVEVGDHASLVAAEGAYAQLVNHAST